MRPTTRNLRLRSQKTLAAGTVGALAAAGAVLMTPAAASAQTIITGSGSSAASSEINALIQKYQALNPSITIKYTANGGNAGISDVQSGTSEFSIQTAAPSAAADGGTTFTKIFDDAVIIGVNTKNKLTSTSFPVLKNIFAGKTTKWSQVKGAKISGAVDPYGRATSAGLYTIIYKAILSPLNQASSIPQETSDGEVAIAVQKDSRGIGYIGLASSHKAGIRGVGLSVKAGGKASTPTAANIRKYLSSGGKSGYPLAHYDYGVLPSSNPNPDAQAFIKWIETSKIAQGIINQSGGLSL